MRKIWIILLCCLGISCSGQQDTVFHDTTGQTILLSQLKGKWIIVNYWADWCESCIHEIPELNQFYQHNSDKNTIFLGVNYDHLSPDQLKQIVNKRHIIYPVLNEDPSDVWQLKDVGVVPATFIINPAGKLVATIAGPTSEKKLCAMLHNLKQ